MPTSAPTLHLVPLTDADLAKRAAVGDEAAFRQIYRQFVGPVRSLLFRLTNAQILDDLTQEVFLRAFRRLSDLRTADTLGPWLKRIAVNAAIDHLRQQARNRTTVLLDEPVARGDGARELEHRQLVQLALGALDIDHRVVLIMHDLEQMADSEVADALGIPRGTVKSRLFNARAKVRLFLTERGVNGVSS